MKSFPTCTMLALTMLRIACLGMIPSLSAQDGGEQTVSSRRVAVLKRLAEERLAVAPPGTDQRRLEQEILARFSIAEPGCPTGVIATPVRGDEAVAASTKRTVDGMVAKRFAPLDPAKLKVEAEAKYLIYKKGDMVDFYYATNPQIARRARGQYRDRNLEVIQVGSKVVRVEDIARIRGNDKLLLRFDPVASEALREAYVEEKLAAHEADMGAFEREANQLVLAKQSQLANEANENEGYLLVAGEWTTAAALVGSLVAVERERLAAVAREKAAVLIARKQDAIAVAVDAQASHEAQIATVAHTNVDAEYAAYKGRLAAAAVVAAQTATVEEPAPVEESGTTGEDSPVEEASGSAEPTPDAEVGTAKTVPVWVYGAIAGVVLLVIVVLAFKMRGGPGKDLKKFFEGRGKVQRTFWQMAEANPDTFKYVAYRYGSGQDARQALLQLSYVNERVGGDLMCRHDIYFGYGAHQDKFVAFVGSKDLHYALWREASAAFPEYPGAEYFRVSTAPDVSLEIPNLDSLLADAELQIEHVENRDGEGTDYSHYYVYTAPGRENALEFLKHAQIEEAGLHVIVLTKGGVFGKDENGIYEETLELWTERYPDFFSA